MRLAACPAAASILVLLGVPGCASIVHKSRGIDNTPPQQVRVTSEPSGATVRLNGVVVGVTPARIPVRRTGPLVTLSVAKDGYETHSVILKRGLSGAAYGNLVFGAAALNPLNGPNGLSDTPGCGGNRRPTRFSSLRSDSAWTCSPAPRAACAHRCT